MRRDAEDSSTWGVPRWLGPLGWLLLGAVVVLVVVEVVHERRVTWHTVVRSLTGLSAVGLIVSSRIGTRATTSGLTTTGIRRRRVTWTQVSDLGPDRSGRWSGVVVAHLVDGTTLQLQGVPPKDLSRLRELREGADGHGADGEARL